MCRCGTAFALYVADPPRTGIPAFSGILDVLAPAMLVMVSCDIATGARDIGIARRFGYKLEKLTLVDCFPRTSHVEWVAVLVESEPDAGANGPATHDPATQSGAS